MFEDKKKACMASIEHLIAASEVLLPYVSDEERVEFEETIAEMKKGLDVLEAVTTLEALDELMDI